MRRAFTLIELLIVVLIIAILAAIAVPNFLEFQTRAKVSRAKSDLRTIAIALEAYYVDWNDYPFGSSTVNGVAWTTTPIAYLSSVPEDPFTQSGSESIIHSYTPYYFYISSKPGGYPGYDPGGSTWQAFRSNWAYNTGYFAPIPNTASQQALPESVYVIARWQLRSPGADRDIDHSVPYDPTNGTLSSGDISLFGPGNSGKGF